MSVDAPGPSDPGRATESPHRWVYDSRGALVYDHEPGLPDGPLPDALRAAAHSSLVGVLLGVLILVVADIFGINEFVGLAAAAAANGLDQVRRGHRLRAFFAYAITVVVCVVPGVWLLGTWLPEPWRSFVPFAVALVIGSQVATVALYLRRRGTAGWPDV
ncbi:hypothetical protein [Micromonospora sp. NPDC004704]